MILSKFKAAPSFAEQMSSIKAAFKTAHENANNLHSMMEEAETFMENISKLI